MKSNDELKKDVQDALKWEPALCDAEIGVSANDGSITLTGEVDSYKKKLHAEDTVKNVSGVKKVMIQKLEVNYRTSNQQTDSEIVKEVLNVLNANWEVADKVQVKVENGQVIISGDLSRQY